jgi:hypothetical protein
MDEQDGEQTCLLETVAQKKVDAIAARVAHESRIGRLRRAGAAVDFLGIAVPLLYAAVRLLAKGTESAVK